MQFAAAQRIRPLAENHVLAKLISGVQPKQPCANGSRATLSFRANMSHTDHHAVVFNEVPHSSRPRTITLHHACCSNASRSVVAFGSAEYMFRLQNTTRVSRLRTIRQATNFAATLVCVPQLVSNCKAKCIEWHTRRRCTASEGNTA